MPRSRPAESWITTGLASERLGLTRQALEELHKRGILTARMRGTARQWSWPTIRDEYHQHRAETIAQKLRPASPDAKAPNPRDRLAGAQADKIEHELAVRRREFVATAFHAREMELFGGRVASAIGSLGPAWRDRLIGLRDETVDDVVEQLSNWLRAECHAGMSEVEDADADPEDDVTDAAA